MPVALRPAAPAQPKAPLLGRGEKEQRPDRVCPTPCDLKCSAVTGHEGGIRRDFVQPSPCRAEPGLRGRVATAPRSAR